MRLIDADALKEEVNKKKVVGRFNVLQLIDKAPTVTVTVNPQEGWWQRLPVVLTSYPPKYKWQCQRCGHEIVTDDLSYPEFPCEKCGAGSKGGAK